MLKDQMAIDVVAEAKEFMPGSVQGVSLFPALTAC